jgi:hypothetical protein
VAYIRTSQEAHITHANTLKFNHVATRIVHRQRGETYQLGAQKVNTAHSEILNEELTWPISPFYSYMKLNVTLERFQRPTNHRIFCWNSVLTSSIYPNHMVTESSFMKREPDEDSTDQASYMGGGAIRTKPTLREFNVLFVCRMVVKVSHSLSYSFGRSVYIDYVLIIL